MSSFVKYVTFDSHNALTSATFWAAAFGMVMGERVPESKEIKNRVHLDLGTTDGIEEEIARPEELGASPRTRTRGTSNGRSWQTQKATSSAWPLPSTDLTDIE